MTLEFQTRTVNDFSKCENVDFFSALITLSIRIKKKTNILIHVHVNDAYLFNSIEFMLLFQTKVYIIQVI